LPTLDKRKGSQIMALSKANAALLASVVVAMAVTETPYAMLTEKEIAGLTKEGLVETNGEIRDGDKIAVRATEKGIALNNENNQGGGTPAPAAASAFALIDGAELPQGRGGRNANVYPFDQMNVGQSFFIAASDAKPNPAKSLASTVSSASKRLNPKKFSVKSVESGKAYGAFTAPSNGALVQRTA
jgi:hypothetical protein